MADLALESIVEYEAASNVTTADGLETGVIIYILMIDCAIFIVIIIIKDPWICSCLVIDMCIHIRV